MTSNLLDLDLLDDDDPFEITSQTAHLYKHGSLGVDDVFDVWRSDPLFYPAKPHPEMTPEEEHEFYSKPENQEPQGPARRRRQPMTDPVPVRFPPEMLERVKAAAADDDRSVSSWIRRAVDRTLQAEAS